MMSAYTLIDRQKRMNNWIINDSLTMITYDNIVPHEAAAAEVSKIGSYTKL